MELVNPTGRFVIGGSFADCGVTGRKLACDTYGGVGHIGGGAMSGKDPSKVDRSGAYMARKIAVDIVKAGYADKCEVQIAYAIGVAEPVSVYVSGPISNCELVNLEDMLQNGTVITDTLIEKPHSFSTACNIATQIIAQVASNTYGGQTISLAHLAPFVDVSRQKYKREMK